jgi:hypothetical protein
MLDVLAKLVRKVVAVRPVAMVVVGCPEDEIIVAAVVEGTFDRQLVQEADIVMLDLVMVCTYTCGDACSQNGAGDNPGRGAHLDCIW